ncbi:MAG: TatD family hydrolase [Myxococcota bacterium]
MWIDSHCHVTADRFDLDRAETLTRAFEGGVDTLISIGSGYGIEGNAEAVRLAHQDSRIFATVGVHPHEASELNDENRIAIRQWLADERVVALGECGLDYHYMQSPREIQLAVFAEQIALAHELSMPVSIHVRGDEPNAYDELLEVWIREGHGEIEGVLHCYTGNLDFAERAMAVGFFVSFSGIVTFKGSGPLREVAKAIPLDRLMVETDAPFLAPEGHRGQRNEPAWVSVVGETLARLHDCSPLEIAQRTTQNARRFYRLPTEGDEVPQQAPTPSPEEPAPA